MNGSYVVVCGVDTMMPFRSSSTESPGAEAEKIVRDL